MIRPPAAPPADAPSVLTRRRLTSSLLATIAAAAVSSAGSRASADEPRLRVGLLEFGTAAWIAETIRAEGLDRAGGFRLEPVALASNEAARIAFQAGAVDVIVSDLLFAARSTAEGRPLVFVPFSSAEGALMVPATSPIRAIADLSGRRIGVAGGALDKGWLLLKAEAARRHGLDLARDAEPIFGAPPLLQRAIATGEIDAVLTFWAFAARLEAAGLRRLLDVGDLARAFGAEGDVALLGWVFRRDFVAANDDLVGRFVAAVDAAGDRLAGDAAAWERLRPLMRAENEATFAALKTRFLAGRPRRPLAAEARDAAALYAALAAIGGPDLVGPAATLPPTLYRTPRDGGS
jgi:NitT/TauT family transport system substrate-binding protein